MYIRVCRVGGGDPGKWWLENEIILPCIKFPTFAPFLFVRVERVGKLEGGGGARQSDIPPVSNFPHLYQFVYKGWESGGMGWGEGLLDNQIFLPCIKSPTFVPFYSACT